MNKRTEKDRIAKMRQDHHDALESLSLSNEECLANAQLIAAAPEMLAALNQVERAWVGDGIGMSTAVDSCLLAIAKATEANA
jgi:hypothetical protein